MAILSLIDQLFKLGQAQAFISNYNYQFLITQYLLNKEFLILKIQIDIKEYLRNTRNYQLDSSTMDLEIFIYQFIYFPNKSEY